jgi:6-phosphogluconolactonase
MKRSIQLGGTLAAALMLTFTACKKEENMPVPQSNDNETTAQREETPQTSSIYRPGYVYTESNTRENCILVYAQQSDGSLKLQSVAKTGGRGNGLPLGSQGSVVIDQYHTWLYAVNSADNTISAFRIGRDGNLMLAGLTSSLGITPVSLAVYKNFLYVVNAGSDNIQGFNTGADGTSRMIPIKGSSQKLSTTGAGAAQISFSPNGAYLYVTEKNTNTISSFYVDLFGVATPAYANSSIGKTPFGFAFSNDIMVVSNAANDAPGAGSATSYVGSNTGTLKATSNPVFNKQTSSCWTAITSNGIHAYITNTHSNTVSVYSVGAYGRLSILFPAIPGGIAPTDIVVDASNSHVYVLSSGDNTIRQYIRRSDGFLTAMIPDGDGAKGLPMTATGLATFSPAASATAVGSGTNK